MFKVHTKLRVISVVKDDSQVADETERLEAFLYKSRVKAQTEVCFHSFYEW